MAVLTVFPHCDMHLALNTPGADKIDFRVFAHQNVLAADGSFQLTDVTAGCVVHFIAPHNPSGSRLHEFVTVNAGAGTIVPKEVGTNLLIFENGGEYIVVRVQVHDKLLGWWFGNTSVTTALDPTHAHAQPSIYAGFSDDPSGTDRIGDITGHGFVTLTSKAPAAFVVDNVNHAGRLRGLAVTPTPTTAELEGTFLGLSPTIKVNVVDYATPQNVLEQEQGGGIADVGKLHNILFLAEGFTASAADKAKFEKLVTDATNQLFDRPRHEPYPTLKESFNVFRAFVPSQQNMLTPGYQVAENGLKLVYPDTSFRDIPAGRPIPDPSQMSADGTKYTVAMLVARVGLPKRGEARNEADLKTLWGGQSLSDFDPNQVDGDVVTAWKNSHGRGLIDARDSYFGMMQGARWADGISVTGAALAKPANEQDAAKVTALVRRAYEFYTPLVPDHFPVVDPRRHPPQLHHPRRQSHSTSIVAVIAGLRMAGGAHEPLGAQWTPGGGFKKSRGLVALICNEPMPGGAADPGLLVAAKIGGSSALKTTLDVAGEVKRLRRDDEDPEITLNGAVDTIAHEFGHSFQLGDEYERFPEPDNFAKQFLDPGDNKNDEFDDYDNITSLEVVFADAAYLANNSRKINPAKLKWGKLPRIKLSALLGAAPNVAGNKIDVVVNPRTAELWEAARVAGEEVHLRRLEIAADGKQLPLSTLDADYLTGLTMDSVDKVTGKIVLSSSEPLVPPPNFPPGTLLFVPHRANGMVLNLIDPKVLAEMTAKEMPLNKDNVPKTVNRGPDFPNDITDFDPPCRTATLIGAFEGAGTYSGLVYRPTGTCKMRTSAGAEENGEFCHVCKWLITNRVDASKHGDIDKRFYPKSKKSG